MGGGGVHALSGKPRCPRPVFNPKAAHVLRIASLNVNWEKPSALPGFTLVDGVKHAPRKFLAEPLGQVSEEVRSVKNSVCRSVVLYKGVG